MVIRRLREVGLMKRTILIVLLLHSLEDAALISVGRFLPFPTPLRYAVGLVLSAVLLWYVLSRQRKVKNG